MKTPSLRHISKSEYQHVYEPIEDTFLLLDALEDELEFIKLKNPTIILEIGSGSGCVSTFISQLLEYPIVFATDINPIANAVTKRTGAANNVLVEAINMRFTIGFRASIDILLFNPPYVVTPTSEISGNGIEVSWAGGIDGREVIDDFLERVDAIMSPNGVVYLIVVNENRPKEILELMEKRGWESRQIKYRVAGNEGLSCLRFERI